MTTHCDTKQKAFAALTLALALCLVAHAGDGTGTIDAKFPDLLKGPLATATLAPLPRGVLVRYGDQTLQKAEIDKIVLNAAPALQAEFDKNALLLAQELVTKRLLKMAARDAAARAGKSLNGLSDAKIIGQHLQTVVAHVDVTEADLVKYHAAHPEQFDGKPLRKVRDTLEKFLRRKLRQDAVNAYVRNLGAQYRAVVDQDWGLKKAAAAADNPVYRVRRAGLPAMVMWSAATCKPCHKMKPHVDKMTRELAGRVNIITVMADEERLLAARYAVGATPTEIFFDANGVERHRDNKYLSRDDIMDGLKKAGLR